MLLATVVAILTCVTVVNATQTITTPNAAFISYSLAVGANSAPITPALSRSVLVMGCCTTTNDNGVGQVSLQHVASGGPFTATIEWVGLESYSGSAITQGNNNAAGTHIVFIGFDHKVDIQVAGTDTIFIHNADTSVRAGNATLVW
jgi:hypothetical protein